MRATPRDSTPSARVDCRFVVSRRTGLKPNWMVLSSLSTAARRVCGLLIVLLLVPATLQAQTPTGQQDSAEVKRYRLADAYMKSGQFERAIKLLEDLRADAPGNPTYIEKLKEAYENVKRYDDAIALVDDRMGTTPTPSRMSEKARLQYLKGDEEAAYATWDRAIGLAPQQSTTYRVVYHALSDIRRFDRAIDILKRGRTALDRPTAFRTELAYLYSLNGEHQKAMQEYVALLDARPERLSFVRSRLRPFVEQSDGLSPSIDALEEAVRASPLNRSYRELLGWLHVENDNYTAAFDVYRAIDRLEEEEGRVLFSFAQKAADGDAYGVASKAYELILERHPDTPVAPQAQKGLGDMYRRQAESTSSPALTASGKVDSTSTYAAAARAYRTFLREYPGHPETPGVLLQLGHLQLDVLGRLDEAEATLQQIQNQFPDADAANEARYDLGRIALLRGTLSDARLAFARLVDRLQTGDLAEQARYELALLHFYRGEFDAALTRAEATNENTSADVANDAIELKVLINQNKGPDSLNTPLRIYADARLHERQRQYDDALRRLDTLLTQYGRHPLSDNARFRRANMLQVRGDTTAALEAFGEIPLMHPRSPFADRSLFQMGTLHEATGELEKATDAYNRLLEEYPNSLLTGDVRSRLRALQRQLG